MIFREEPPDFNKNIDVVGCFVQHNDKFVLLHRHSHKANGNKLGLPAGKVRKGENMYRAMQREIQEETGLIVSDKKLKYFESVFVRNRGYDIKFHMFSATIPKEPIIRISQKEHKGYLWTSPEEALSMDLIHDLDECIRLFCGVK